ncbi:MAG: PKD domain-containing protein [Paludibacter sp.]|nr:PKD domain-containing protein [Bacteroidales bacterium]MCM1069719.1 PKD domain-containing protein [Prevotella sp.]MCM1354373.1 PKD domain-containing protein [Bacteroides sp.]MCM1441920.1 PKD domain-containing protein [Muribaculum sp.]MCM1482571.1 PKD domain-containing protein [Paludibacter sp.]
MKKNHLYIGLLGVLLLMAGCREHEPIVEELPADAVSFTYLINGDYPLDYYVDSEIQFTNTSKTKGNPVWSFGDGTTAEGDVVSHVYDEAGSYIVTLSIRQTDGSVVSKKQPCMITDIKPLMTINPFEEGVCEVLSTKVSFNIELPNPKNRQEEYLWIFPEGTTTIEGEAIETSTDRLPGEIIFNNVGSQTVRLQARLDGRLLEEASINVQVGYNKPVPTLYYAVKGGNLMALKLADDAPEDMTIAPYDLAVSSGQHPFCLLFADSLLYLLDCGKQFYYVDDADGVLGDGKISVISKDGTKVETMISNVGQAAFDDPFYGYIEGNYLYFSNRNTGIVQVPLSDRNKMYSAAEYPYYVQHSTLEYYKNGWDYGCIGGTFGKVNGVWYWGKFYNGKGLFRFADSDILKSPTAQGTTTPEAGIALSSMGVKSFVYNKKTDEFFFTILDEGYNTIYRCPSLADLEAIGNKKTNLPQYKLQHESGLTLDVNVSGKPAASEGTTSEPVGICELALDESTGCVYFGYRSSGEATDAPSGLMRYNPATQKVETVIPDVEVYGLVVNPTPSKLF